METKDQRKVALSESPSVHICSKCGWPFPKPHPSAKHRRAHKRICGTIEGYKLIDLPNLGASDNERGSDEDPKTPSPKLEKRSSEEISGGGGVGGRSNRSEDEVFSDAVTEFSDSSYSPGHEDTLKGVIVSDKKVGSLVECDSDNKQQPEVVVSTGGVPPLNCSTDSSQMHDAEAPETESKSLASAIPTEDIVSNGNSHQVSSSNNKTEDLPLENSDVDVSACSQISAGSLKEDGKDNVVEQETSVKEKQENGSDEVLSDVVVTPSEFSKEASEFSFVGLETDLETLVHVTSDQIGEFEKDQNPEDSHQRKNLSYTDQTEADPPKEGDAEGEDETVHVLSADDIPMVDRAAVLIEDFKDHKPVKSNLLPKTLDFEEEIEHVGDAKKDTINGDDGFSFHPRKPDETAAIPSSGLPLLEGEFKQRDGGGIVSVKEVPSEATADMSDVSEKMQSKSGNKDHETEDGICGQESLEEAKVVKKIDTTETESVDDLSVTKSDQSINLLAVDCSKYSENGHESSDATGNGTIPEMVLKTTLISAHVSEPHVVLDEAMNDVKKDLQESATPFHEVIVENTAVGHSSQHNMLHEDSQEATKESKVDTTNEVPVESNGTVPECPGSSHNIGAEVSHDSKETSLEPHLVEADLVWDNGHTNGIVDASGVGTKQQQEGRDENFTNRPIKTPVIDASVDSSSQSDSLEGNWGSTSAFSTQSDAVDAVTPPPTTPEVPVQNPEINPKEQHSSAETDAFEAPSFMTLVEPENRAGQEAPSDAQQAESKDVRAAWFPSITNVVNDSEGRKKNEEIIAKVTNWSTTGVKQPQHTPLKSLLVEANPETKLNSPKKEEKGRKENDVPVLTVNSILGLEAATDEDSKREIGKEWDSPARYPSEIKKEKKKNKGRPYWVPFVCCSSVNN